MGLFTMEKLRIACFPTSVFPIIPVSPTAFRKKNRATSPPESRTHLFNTASHIVAYSVASHNRPRRLIDPLPISTQTPFVCFYSRLAIYSCLSVTRESKMYMDTAHPALQSSSQVIDYIFPQQMVQVTLAAIMMTMMVVVMDAVRMMVMETVMVTTDGDNLMRQRSFFQLPPNRDLRSIIVRSSS